MYLGALWVLSGMESFTFGSIAGVTAKGFVLLGVSPSDREGVRTFE